MSHFSVLVIGGDVETQLAPYHEFECTGKDDQYVQTINETEEALEGYAKSDKSRTLEEWVADYWGREAVGPDEPLDLEGDHKYGYTMVDKDGKFVSTFGRTNPNKEWDWWVVGGRFKGKLRGKDGGKYDSLAKGEIDIGRMRNDAAAEATVRFNKFEALTDKCVSVIPWNVVRDEMYPKDIDAARNFYHQQPMVQALKKSGDEEAFWWDAEDFAIGREKYIQNAYDSALLTFAVVKDGQWYQRGEMGWWACVSNEKDRDAWLQEFNALIDGLPDGTMMTVVDCHI